MQSVKRKKKIDYSRLESTLFYYRITPFFLTVFFKSVQFLDSFERHNENR